ncbi:hypothetical protein P171DRAFT_429986 [Karstenula rhodostoma CBS 690.94]|uniref:Uncharacterized protein n=1 Tax=Karstenula rhodostoma CBS 690.94 TaxID=1392251 RepID=A0A9P4PL20_9PLEO|nr:hypothetical protein P171DRAFT_429986 [Karstenula rhodostoma CBS 690.94]
MSHWTCYSEPAFTCLEVPKETGAGNEDTPKNTKTTRTEDDGKPAQTDDKTQPEATKPAESRPSSIHTTVLATSISKPTTATEINSDAVETALPSLAAGTADGNNGSGGGGGVSPGAVAGIAIATAIIGAAIAFFAAFMLFKRRRPSRHGHGESSTNFITTREQPSYVQVSQVGPPPILAAAVPTSNRGVNLSDLSHSSDFLSGVLPAAADDQIVKSRVTAVFGQIRQHVNDFYRDVHATLTPSMENDLQKFGDSYVNLAEELEHSSMPTIAIKHALIGYLLNIVAPEAEQQSTLFPAEVAGLRQNERSFESAGQITPYATQHFVH